ncbi:MAG: Bax inhibitor-1/YccA family protein [Bacteroidales bacterium]|nr:Bax inhibitor-1/YccA family protein [Bacteroidales bacterium]
MRFTNTSNPVLTNKAFQVEAGNQTMTVSSAINKTIVLFLILVATASISWRLTAGGSDLVYSLLWPSAILGFGIALVTIFAKKYSAITAPLYAAVEGFFLGAISMVYNFVYPGIIIQAVLLTMGIMGVMLFAYKTGVIKVTQKFRTGVLVATGGIAIVYLISFVMNMFGAQMPYIHDGGIIGIGISLFIVIIAALNLVLDFSFIDEVAKSGAPKYMEWYSAFGLMVTLIWLYLEIFRLLGKIRN